MSGKLLPKGCMYEVKFNYHFKMGGYTTLMLNIVKFYAMPRQNEERSK